jgi:hypothetical protein
VAGPGAVPRAGTERRSGPIATPDDRTPPPIVFPPAPPADDTLALHGRPAAAELAAEISARLALPGLRSLTIDLDGAELLDDDLVRVLRRARAAAWTAGIEIATRATRVGTLRWLARHGLGDGDKTSGSGDRREPPRRS